MQTKKVLVGGCFDLIHFGHTVFLEKSKGLGDYLVVALESDENVTKLKGKGRPFHSQAQRAKMLESLTFVDEVIKLPTMKSDTDYERLVKKVKPAIIAVTKGDPLLEKKRSHAAKVDAKVFEIPKLRVSSTSKILEKLNY